MGHCEQTFAWCGNCKAKVLVTSHVCTDCGYIPLIISEWGGKSYSCWKASTDFISLSEEREKKQT